MTNLNFESKSNDAKDRIFARNSSLEVNSMVLLGFEFEFSLQQVAKIIESCNFAQEYGKESLNRGHSDSIGANYSMSILKIDNI